MSVTIYLPKDAAALALGADEVAAELTRLARAAGRDLNLVRTGSRGLFWLEPMVEVATPGGRIAYGPVEASDVEGLVAAGLFEGGAHPLRLGAPAAGSGGNGYGPSDMLHPIDIRLVSHRQCQGT